MPHCIAVSILHHVSITTGFRIQCEIITWSRVVAVLSRKTKVHCTLRVWLGCRYSAFRDVPDNQEVFSDAATDQSIIIEILERSADVADDAFLAHIFSDLVEADDVATLTPSVRVDSWLLSGVWHWEFLACICASVCLAVRR
jgi:hypothetical protein